MSEGKADELLKATSSSIWKRRDGYTLQRCGDYAPLPDELKDAITIGKIRDAQNLITEGHFIRKTPVINGITINGIGKDSILNQLESFSMKCENMQFSGSFKIRGASYQFSQFPDISKQNLVTISAGNYGTAFATLAKQIGVAQNAMVFMPKTVPQRRKARIEAFGLKVNCDYDQSDLITGVEIDRKERNSAFLHPFDDVNVTIGHGSAGLELLEQEPLVDIVLVCCGGGGFLAGVTAAIRLSACTMFDSLVQDKISYMTEDPAKTICHGISAPYTGDIPFKVFRALGDGIIKIEENDIKRTVKLLYEMGLVVEPSGAAAVAAVLSDRVPDIAGKRVVAFITGGNVSPHELENECDVRI